MSKSAATYEQIGAPIISRAISVPTSIKYDWLRHLNEHKGITAGPVGNAIGEVWISEGGVEKVNETYILVSVETRYDRPPGLQARLGEPHPSAVVYYIDEVIRLVDSKLSQSK